MLTLFIIITSFYLGYRLAPRTTTSTVDPILIQKLRSLQTEIELICPESTSTAWRKNNAQSLINHIIVQLK